tara:strand:- start:9619 stop:9987 length:369 start_codon:yes stop_codon:yes gene_type:complete
VRVKSGDGCGTVIFMVIAGLAIWWWFFAKDEENIATLYRNSEIDHSMRIHVATFDAEESDKKYNINNCEMSARLRNANIVALINSSEKSHSQDVGFWCEIGSYDEDGPQRIFFSAEFPTNTE